MQRHASRRTWLLAASLLLLSACGTALSLESIRDREGYYVFREFRYRGAISNGQPHGQGNLIFNNGIRINGGFRAGLPHGPAVVTVPRWGVIDGTFERGALTRGVAELDGGAIYNGGFSDWKFSGTGLLTGTTEQYHGQFQNGVPHGAGVRYNVDTRELVEGNFVNGRLHGEANTITAGRASLQHYDGGRNVTANTVTAAAGAAITADLRREITQRQAAVTAAAAQVEAAKRPLLYGTKAGADEFNRECSCLARLYERQGGYELSTHACLVVTDSNTPRPTREQEREWERAREVRRAACMTWGRNFMDPDARTRAYQARLAHDNAVERQRAAELARQRAEQRLRQVEADLRENRRSQEVETRARAIEAERTRKAREWEAQRRQVCSARPNSCGCKVATPCKTKGCASCQ